MLAIPSGPASDRLMLAVVGGSSRTPPTALAGEMGFVPGAPHGRITPAACPGRASGAEPRVRSPSSSSYAALWFLTATPCNLASHEHSTHILWGAEACTTPQPLRIELKISSSSRRIEPGAGVSRAVDCGSAYGRANPGEFTNLW